MTTEKKSERLYETLFNASATPKRQSSLQRLREACDVLESQRKTITLKEIERFIVKKHGQGEGPKAQSISNSPDCLKAYVDCRIHEQVVANSEHRKVPAKSLEECLKGLEDDPATISMLLGMQTRIKQAEDEVRRAKELLSHVDCSLDVDAFIHHGKKKSVTPPKVSAESLAPLQNLIALLQDENRLNKAGLTRSPTGRVVRLGNRECLIPEGVVCGVENLLKELATPVLALPSP